MSASGPSGPLVFIYPGPNNMNPYLHLAINCLLLTVAAEGMCHLHITIFQKSLWRRGCSGSICYQLDQFISVKGLFGGIFHFYSNFNRVFCKQTVETQISDMGLHSLTEARLIWVKGMFLFGPKYLDREDSK